jgi:hypothetical protein
MDGWAAFHVVFLELKPVIVLSSEGKALWWRQRFVKDNLTTVTR